MLLNLLKKLFGTKFLIRLAIDELDALEPLLAAQLDKAKSSFNALDSQAKSKWIVDKVQDFLRDKLNVNETPQQ